eukprot:scaffold132632_cov78-Phaeocystis_antarctica.AAC.3
MRAAAHGNAYGAWAHPEDDLRLAQQRNDTFHRWTAVFATLDLVDHHVSRVPLLLWQRLLHPVGDAPHGCSPGLVDGMPARLERNHAWLRAGCEWEVVDDAEHASDVPARARFGQECGIRRGVNKRTNVAAATE